MDNLISLIEKAQKGDQSSFYALYSETYPKNRYVALKYMKQEFDANDVLQDAYIRIYNNLDKYTYTGEGSFQSWTSKIVSNTALNHLRKNNPLLFSEVEDEEGNSIITDFEDERVESQPELFYDKKETSEIVNELLGELSDEQRIAVMMFYFQEFSVKEIAVQCSCSENTVKSRLNYARKNLEKKATDLRKKGILTSAFTISALYILLKDDCAMAAVGAGINNLFDAVWSGITIAGSSNVAGVGGAAVSGAGYILTAKTIAIIGVSAVLVTGVVFGVCFIGGLFSNGQGRLVDPGTSTPAIISTATPVPTNNMQEPTTSPDETLMPTPTSTPELTPEKTPKPGKTKKPRRTHKPTSEPEPTPRRTKKPDITPEPADWDDDFTDWDDDFTDWDD